MSWKQGFGGSVGAGAGSGACGTFFRCWCLSGAGGFWKNPVLVSVPVQIPVRAAFFPGAGVSENIRNTKTLVEKQKFSNFIKPNVFKNWRRYFQAICSSKLHNSGENCQETWLQHGNNNILIAAILKPFSQRPLEYNENLSSVKFTWKWNEKFSEVERKAFSPKWALKSLMEVVEGKH